MRLANKVAIVTGGASGFGAATARRFVGEGAKVIIADMNLEGAQEVVKSIGPSAIAVQVDVTKLEDVESAVAQAVSQFGGLHIYINNAGYSHLNNPMLDVDESAFDRTFEVNGKAIYLAAQAAVPALRVSGKSAFIIVCFTAEVRPSPGMTWHAGSKAAAIRQSLWLTPITSH
jgi:3-oxoacyl-[acyl-carrier protein] reductase